MVAANLEKIKRQISKGKRSDIPSFCLLIFAFCLLIFSRSVPTFCLLIFAFCLLIFSLRLLPFDFSLRRPIQPDQTFRKARRIAITKAI